MAIKGMRKFSSRLQSSLSVDDQEWVFEVPDVPHENELDQAGLVKYIVFATSSTKQGIVLSLEPVKVNRAISSIPLHSLLLVSFANFRLSHSTKEGSTTLQRGTVKETEDYIIRFLSSGVTINGSKYNFYGHSNSQLKSRTCFMCASPKEDISARIENLGDFSTIKTVGKKAKRIGLLFSTAEAACLLQSDRYEDIDDVESGEYIFTDGCGLISPEFAKLLVKKLDISFRNRRYLPSVYQIRYRGYKGVLELDKRLSGKVCVKFRKSMRKFRGGDDLSFAVVEYSKPYAFGHLNDEIILLLHSLGISADTLIEKQEQHLRLLSDAAALDMRAVFRFLSYVDEQDLAERVLLDGPEIVARKIRKLVAQEHNSMLNKRQEQRCRIFVLDSRLLYGVCDPVDCLREGECFVRITADGDGQPRTLINSEVVVTRNPCLHPGDLQKFKVADKPALSHLVDCIVFPTRGKRPSADLMSGGDLDGDKFFVCWDKQLIPTFVAQPAEYPGVPERRKGLHDITDQDRLEYFAKASNSSLGKVKNLYLDWAGLKGPLSAECQELNRLFSQCVDGNRIRLPNHLEQLPPAAEDKPPFILDVLHQASAAAIMSYQLNQRHLDGCSFETIDELLSEPRLAASEFEIIQLTFRWCSANDVLFSDFAHHFDFNLLNVEEKAWVCTQLPAERHLVQNSLNQSHLLLQTELSAFRLNDHRIHWKKIFDSSSERMSRFFEVNSRVCELFYRKFLVLRVDERLTIAIYIPCQVEKGHEKQIDDRVRVFSFPHPHDTSSTHRRALKTKKTYKIFCDDRVFQLYEGQRRSTWIFLQRGGSDDSAYRNAATEGSRRRARQSTIDSNINHDLRASVDLGRFSQRLSTQIGRVNRNGVVGAEIYVISNQDLASFRTLDLWLDYVDTETVHPLFSGEAQIYELPNFADAERAQVPSSIATAVKSDNFNGLYKESVGDLDHLFLWLLDRDEKVRLYKIYERILHDVYTDNMVSYGILLELMVDYLEQAPYLVLAITKSNIWSMLPKPMEHKLCESAPRILRGLILQVNEIGFLVVPAFQAMVSRWRLATFQTFGELIETMSLTVSDLDLAMDLLLTCLEPASIGIMIGRPSIIKRFVMCLLGVALNHIEDANESKPEAFGLLNLTPKGKAGEMFVYETRIRIDAPKSTALRTGDHVRLTPASRPSNSPTLRFLPIDALVSSSEQGCAVLHCLQRPPSFVESCSWRMKHCGSFVTSKAMFDATVALYARQNEVCQLYDLFNDTNVATDLISPSVAPNSIGGDSFSQLNPSQKAAVQAGLTSPLTCLWGPPGTGKTHTICALLAQISRTSPESRILVTAPTNNAVDNMLRMFVKAHAEITKSVGPLRVSTDVNRVSSDLKEYAVDGIMDATDPSRFKSRKNAAKRIEKCRLVFTTCIGAGLGLLRQENFDIVLIDEASQVTEPESYVPLTKECKRAILVGDHVQLRPIVGQHSVLAGLDISLFERLHVQKSGSEIAKVMLDTQYRMPEAICEFSSNEFYEEKLKTAETTGTEQLPSSSFPWPTMADGIHCHRKVFVQCSDFEDIGHRSKGNAGQANLTQEIYRRLETHSGKDTQSGREAKKPSIVILTPYTRQRDMIKAKIPGVEVASVDSFQGKEADIIIFVTVRCNVKGDLGFLKDMRRLNVALTRAKAGLIVVGDRTTLTHVSEDNSNAVWRRLLDWLPIIAINN